MINNNKSCWEKNAKRYDKIIGFKTFNEWTVDEFNM